MRLVSRAGLALVAVAAASGLSVALAQAQGSKRTVLQRVDVVGPEQKECVLGSAELAPGGSAGKHIHHGFEIGVVTEGEGDLTVDGQAPRRLKAGDSYRVDTRVPHDSRTPGPSSSRWWRAGWSRRGSPWQSR